MPETVGEGVMLDPVISEEEDSDDGELLMGGPKPQLTMEEMKENLIGDFGDKLRDSSDFKAPKQTLVSPRKRLPLKTPKRAGKAFDFKKDQQEEEEEYYYDEEDVGEEGEIEQEDTVEQTGASSQQGFDV